MMTTKPRTATAWRKAIEDLKNRRTKAETKAAEIDARRGEFVLAAQLGDEAAKAKLAEYDARLDEARREARDLHTAINQAEAALTETEHREAEGRRKCELAEAQKLEREARGVAGRLDRAVEQAAADANEVKRLLVQAARLRGVSNTHVANRLELAIRGAYWHHHLKVGDHVEPRFRRPLVENLAGLLGLHPLADSEDRECAA